MNSTKVKIAIAMPIFNEADGIEKTLKQIDSVMNRHNFVICLFLQNDCSTDNTIEIVQKNEQSLNMRIEIENNPANLGHGPTTLEAYRRATSSDFKIVLQLDSDGQFDPDDLPRLLQVLNSSTKVAYGIRTNRVDPWYRKIITLGLRVVLRIIFNCGGQDPNTPIRAYERIHLKSLLDHVPKNSPTPNILLTVIANRLSAQSVMVKVAHRSREGKLKTGTMWRDRTRFKIFFPKRLFLFSANALFHLIKFRFKLIRIH